MFATLVKLKQNALLLGLALALVGVGGAPLLGGSEAVAAKKGKPRGPSASAETRFSRQDVQRFENTEVRLGIIDGVGTVASSSAIEVSGLAGPLTDVNVNLIGITHGPTSTQDIDVLLIGPEGRTALILSDVGGNTPTQNVSLVLDDQQPEQLPSAAALTNGFFQPTNVGSPDTMNLGSGPFTPPSGSSLGAFNGIDPNGTWRLWAYDDEPNGSSPSGGGINGGWALTITTAGSDPVNGKPTAAPDRFKAKAGKTLRVNGRGVLRNDRDPDDGALTAILVRRPTQGRVQLKADGSFTYKANKRAGGKDSFTYLAKDSSGLQARATVHIEIKAHKQGNGSRNRGRGR